MCGGLLLFRECDLHLLNDIYIYIYIRMIYIYIRTIDTMHPAPSGFSKMRL